jgi:hypothetical protein
MYQEREGLSRIRMKKIGKKLKNKAGPFPAREIDRPFSNAAVSALPKRASD